MRQLDEIRQELKQLVSGQSVVAAGLVEPARSWLVAGLVQRGAGPFLWIFEEEKRLEETWEELRFFLGERPQELAADPFAPKVARLPASEESFYDEISPDRQLGAEKLATLFRLAEGKPPAVTITTATALQRLVPPVSFLEQESRLVLKDQELDLTELATHLVRIGYLRTPQVEEPGCFSIRGGILDVFCPLYPSPVRIELLGDEVESIRVFDVETQLTRKKLESFYICPVREIVWDEKSRDRARQEIEKLADLRDLPSSRVLPWLRALQEGDWQFGIEALLAAFWSELVSPLSFWPQGTILVAERPQMLVAILEKNWQRAQLTYQEICHSERLAFPPERWLASPQALSALLGKFAWLQFEAAESEGKKFFFQSRQLGELKSSASSAPSGKPWENLEKAFSDWRHRGRRIFLVAIHEDRAREIKKLLLTGSRAIKEIKELPPTSWRAHPPSPSEPLWLVMGELGRSFEISDGTGGEVFISEELFFPKRSRPRPYLLRRSKFSIQPGDLVVHIDFGIGRFEQMVKLRTQGGEGDFLKLIYRGGDVLYLPVTRINLLSRYRPADSAAGVQLSRLGSGTWNKTKQKVQQSLLEMARQLLATEASRRLAQKKSALEIPQEFWNFAASFHWEETPDQRTATEEVLEDLASPVVMDRLLCGDVGFGKTEIAVRAAYFKALHNQQTAVLVPTTVLALQHLATFRSRLADRAVRVEMLSRLVPRARQAEILADLASGKIDVIIGTHRLLQRDVTFANLGLLVIDEEQRFGVRHKEKLKTLKKDVDVLTMTATPLPRTLNQALSGLRRISVIQTPPPGRQAIRTVVTRFSPRVVAEAIRAELARGGQVFLLHNWVRSLPAMERFVKRLVPEARTAYAHGQMSERELERVMTAFVKQEIDVLVCTSIIESGLDIPSANTIIINRADLFGLSQLYQIRGRVGRSRQAAHAYLLTPAPETLSADARQRLEVLLQYSQPGSGYQVAYQDMEIRGAGNLLGRDQSGHINAVGFDLYTRLLEKAIAEVRGQGVRDEAEPEITLPVTGFLPEFYIPQLEERLDFYGRMASATDPQELERICAEMIDRFGPLPPEAECLRELTELGTILRRLRAERLEWKGGKLVLWLRSDTTLDTGKLADLVQQDNTAWCLNPQGAVIFTPDEVLVREPLLAARLMLEKLAKSVITA